MDPFIGRLHIAMADYFVGAHSIPTYQRREIAQAKMLGT